jgi:probable addiction module antidote protein
MPRSISYESYLRKALKDPREALAYLNATINDADPRVFPLALRNVIAARGGVAKIARKCNLSRNGTYRILSKNGNLSIQNLGRLLSSMGFRLAVENKEAVRRSRNRQ